MDPYEIEDSSDWLGCPTELETCRHFLRMTENEVQELTLQLRKAREDIFGLVQMHAEVSSERDQLRADLNRARSEAADAKRQVTNIEIKTNGELMANSKVISELYAKLLALTGVAPFTQIPRDQGTSLKKTCCPSFSVSFAPLIQVGGFGMVVA